MGMRDCERRLGKEVSARLRVNTFELSGYALTSHTPDPSPEGRFGMLLFFVDNECVVCGVSPLERG